MASKMKPQEQIRTLFDHQPCWTIDQLNQTLDYSTISIRRFLKQLGYVTSFTHNSKWYTLDSIPSFNNNGIWFCDDIGFSRYGNLKQSILHHIDKSPQGLSARQLADIFSITCHAILNHMYKSATIERVKETSDFIYISVDPNKKDQQLIQLKSVQPIDPTYQKLSAHSAVYVLVEYIKKPQASFAQLSKAVAKKQIIATPDAIARFFDEHDLLSKKTLD
jgi:hypothetical protein